LEEKHPNTHTHTTTQINWNTTADSNIKVSLLSIGISLWRGFEALFPCCAAASN
jgi:hypothetical protein